MKITEVRDWLERVRDLSGYNVAVSLIRDVVGVERLADVPEDRYGELVDAARRHLQPTDSDRLVRAADLLKGSFAALANQGDCFMAAMDKMQTAVDRSVAEMGKAADVIRNHPAAQNDAALMDMANRLQAAADALSGVDAGSDTVTGAGADTTAGAASGGSATVAGAGSDTVSGA